MTNQEIKDTGLRIRNEQQIGGNTALRVGGVIEGIGYALDNKDAANGYYQATIRGGSISVNAPNYLLGTSGNLRLKMPAAGTTASTLTIGNANAVQLWYNGAAVSAQNTWEQDEIISVFYDGTRFMASNSQGGGGKANKIKYNNSQSGLAAENVQEALDDIGNEIFIEGDTLPFIGPISCVISTSTWEWTSRASSHYLVKVSEGDRIRITARNDKNATCIWLTSNEDPDNGDPAPVVSQEYIVIDAGKSKTVEVPATAEYAYLLGTHLNVQYAPSSIIKVNSLKKDVIELEEVVSEIRYATSEKLYPLGLTIVGYLAHPVRKNWEQQDSRHRILSVNSGDTFKIVANEENDSFYCWLKNDNAPTNNGQVPLSDIDNNIYSIEAGGTTDVITAPSDAHYLYVSDKNGNGAMDTSPQYILRQVAVNKMTEDNNTAIKDLADEGEILTAIPIKFTDGERVNDTGEEIPHAASSASGYIDVSQYSELKVPTMIANTGGYALYSVPDVSGYITGGKYTIGEYDSIYDYVYRTIKTNGAKYIRITGYSSSFQYFKGYPKLYAVSHADDSISNGKVVTEINNNIINGSINASLVYTADSSVVTTSDFIYVDEDTLVTCDDEYGIVAFCIINNARAYIDADGNVNNASSGYKYNPSKILKKGTECIVQMKYLGKGEKTLEDYRKAIHFTKKVSDIESGLKHSFVSGPYWESFGTFNSESESALVKETVLGNNIDIVQGGVRRIPTVAITDSGTELVVSDMEHTQSDASNSGLILARRVVGGSWTYNYILPYDSVNREKYMNASLTVVRSGTHAGRIYLFFMSLIVTDSNNGLFVKADTSEADNKYIYSDDDGVTWSEQYSTKEAWNLEEWVAIIVAPCHGIDKGNGIIVIPCMGKAQSGYATKWHSGLMFLDTATGTATYTNPTPHEGDNECTVYSKYGVLYLNCRRDRQSNITNNVYVRDNIHMRSLYMYNEVDGKFIEVNNDEDPMCRCQQSICSFGNYFLRTKNDPETEEVRERLTVYASKDGLHWSPALLLAPEERWGYSNIQYYNNKVICAYENKGPITFVDLTPAISLFEKTAMASAQNDEWRMQKMLENLKE